MGASRNRNANAVDLHIKSRRKLIPPLDLRMTLSLQELPLEVLSRIFSFLDLRSYLHASECCRDFDEICNERSAWMHRLYSLMGEAMVDPRWLNFPVPPNLLRACDAKIRFAQAQSHIYPLPLDSDRKLREMKQQIMTLHFKRVFHLDEKVVNNDGLTINEQQILKKLSTIQYIQCKIAVMGPSKVGKSTQIFNWLRWPAETQHLDFERSHGVKNLFGSTVYNTILHVPSHETSVGFSISAVEPPADSPIALINALHNVDGVILCLDHHSSDCLNDMTSHWIPFIRKWTTCPISIVFLRSTPEDLNGAATREAFKLMSSGSVISVEFPNETECASAFRKCFCTTFFNVWHPVLAALFGGNKNKIGIEQLSSPSWKLLMNFIEDLIEPAPARQKLEGYDYWKYVLKSPKYVLGPMVDGSELPFRMLARRHGADLCFSPMMLSPVFATSAKHREVAHSTCPEDRPLIVQFCGTEPETVLTAAKHVENECDGVDLNLGCPQSCAKRGGYGAFLPDTPEVVYSIVDALHQNLAVPVTCKIRLNPSPIKKESIERTIEFAVKLQDHGCQLLTVHGRTRDQKGHKAGIADWNAIREVKRHLRIPVIANGSVESLADAEMCLAQSNADAAMAASAMLTNPYLFDGSVMEGDHILQFKAAREYLEICQTHPASRKFQDFHIFPLLRPIFETWPETVKLYEKSQSYESINACFDVMQQKLAAVNGILPARQSASQQKLHHATAAESSDIFADMSELLTEKEE